MQAYDLHVHSAFSGGESSLEQLAKTAKQLGYGGVCLVFYYKDKRQKDIILAEIEKLKKQIKFEIYLGFEARTIKELRFLAKRRKNFDILLARGGDLRLNRAAVETAEVDILTHPEYERNDSGLNHVLVKLAAKNNVAIEVNFREILTSTKKTRSKVLSNIQSNIKLAKKYRAPIILCSGSISHWELRDPQVLISMATQLGLTLKEAKESITKIPSKIIKLSKKRRCGNWILPGVKIVR